MKMKCPHCGVNGSVSESLVGKRVKCPKCGEIFSVPLDTDAASPKPEMHASEHFPASESAAEIPVQDDAALDEELERIFQDMKNSEQDQNPEPGEAERNVQPHAVTTGSASEETLEVREGDGADAEGFDDEESLSAVENIPAEKCSACGVPADNTTLSIHDGLTFCQTCVPEKTGEADLSPVQEPDVPNAQDAGEKGEQQANPAGKIRLAIGGIAVAALILLAVYLMTSK